MDDLLPIAQAVKAMPLLTGGSGLGAALANVDSQCPWAVQRNEVKSQQVKTGKQLFYRCSVMTNKQVQAYQQALQNVGCG